ncbi:cytoskeletal protein Sojo-like [Asterias rubens]|uniref:cytoskeletal protein Sojo-like n=1 Tax=Asterias rubens TaxID=7604 RepID=UPI0014558719|nr:cytoskeletal protein Sojo-like [Asterias rubens]
MRANEDGQRVSQLEAALLICKEELTGYIDKLDGMRDRHEKDLQSKKTEMKKLEKQLKQAKEELETVADQVLELKQALNERQQSASRMAEGQLENQVSHLETGLNHITTEAENDAAMIEKKLHQACMDLEDRTTQLTEITTTLRYLLLLEGYQPQN